MSPSTRQPPTSAPPADTRVIVGMSGGVDSSVAAWLLKEQGYQVAGLFMKNWDEDDGTEYCTAEADLADARRVAAALDIELHTANFAAEYWDDVFESFLAEYRAGRTPNPDVLCNREIKFKQFVDYASALGADCIATGHYARIAVTGDGPRLARARDANKDQTYFLQAVPLAQLARCLFPLGTMTKGEVRRLAGELGFHNARKKDSTGICFIGERRFRDFLARYLPRQPGPMVSTAGEPVGEHQGLAYYTLGQRQGLGIGGLRGHPERPWYVAGKRQDGNTLLVTQDQDQLLSDQLLAGPANWLGPAPTLPLRCTAKVRYRQADQPCWVRAAEDGRLRVDFDQPQRAVSPGQYVCFYAGDYCLGGSVIEAIARGPALAWQDEAVAATPVTAPPAGMEAL